MTPPGGRTRTSDQPSQQHDTFNLYDVSGLGHVELIRALRAAGDPMDLPVTTDDRSQALTAQLDEAAAHSAADPFGFGSGHGDPSPHAFGLSAEAAWYDDVTGTDRYADLQASQLSWPLGANAWGSTFVIGAGSTFRTARRTTPRTSSARSTGRATSCSAAAWTVPPATSRRGSSARRRRRPVRPTGKNPFRPFDQSDWRYVDRVASWATVEPADDYSILPFIAFVEQMAS